MYRDYFLNIVYEGTERLFGINDAELICEKPKNPEYGDFSVNVSSLARTLKMPPPKIAQNIVEDIERLNISGGRENFEKEFDVSCTSGFVNFKVNEKLLNNVIKEIAEKKGAYGKNNKGKGEKVNLEYVSANPTGPFHIGHGRWAAMGSSLANLMTFCGYDVYQEFYINDAGSQIGNLGRSLEIRIRQQLGEDVDFPQGDGAKNYYAGDYLIPVAKKYIELNGAKIPPQKELEDFAKVEMLKRQKELLEKMRVHFDCFYSELDLHKSGKVKKCIEELKKCGKLYEKEGATWFKSSDYGDDQDRVIIKQDGSYTYLTADIAYHWDKLERGFNKLINIWGADHHGYVARMKAAIDALGYNSDSLTVLLGQLVNLLVNGEAARMGKRKNMVTLDELVEDVGVDAARYWMIMRSIDTTLDFDIELAKSKCDENPVFYVQYAHARACSILRNAISERADIQNNKVKEPLFVENELDEILKIGDIKAIWSGNEEENESAKKLILKLEEFKSLVEVAMKNHAPYMLCRYMSELAAVFHHFYGQSRVLTEDKKLAASRLNLVNSVKTILNTSLNLIGVTPVERM